MVLLNSIGSTEPSDFNEICAGLKSQDSLPEGKAEWSSFFRLLDDCESKGLIELDKIKGKIESAQLTENGVDFLKRK